MIDLPEWALPIRDEMAERMKAVPTWDGDTLACNLTRDELANAATAALVVAMPLIADHMAGVVESEAGQYSEDGDGDAWIALRIAAAIRQEATPRKP